jgi:hypothetical protein
MIDPAQIPFSVCYAIKQHILVYGYSTDPSELAAAALAAWPGMTLAKWEAYGERDRLVLPLTEARDE